MTTKTPTLWLVRESKEQGGWYFVCSGPKPRKPKTGWIYDSNVPGEAFCSKLWNSLCPKSLHLRPGGGPIHIVVRRGRRTR